MEFLSCATRTCGSYGTSSPTDSANASRHSTRIRSYGRSHGQPKLRRQLKSATKGWHWYSAEQFKPLMLKCDAWKVREEDAGREGRKWVAFKGMVAVAYTAGLRLGEVLHLTWPDVDLDAEEIVVAPKLSTDTTLCWGPKDHERRIVPLAAAVRTIFKQLRETATDGNPYVFVSAKRHARATRSVATGTWREGKPLINNVRRDFRALCKAAKVPICAFHSLRKSCCTNLLEGGVAPHAVQKIMGHTSGHIPPYQAKSTKLGWHVRA